MIVVVDYRAGNLYNVGNALNFLGAEYAFSSDPEVIQEADKVILPGVGSARAAMESLKEQQLCDLIRQLKVPFLGICLGMQLLFESSEEDSTECLGILPGRVRRFSRKHVKVPHIGWNQVCWRAPMKKRFPDLEARSFYYFVHSYYAPVSEHSTAAISDYDVEFASAVVYRNFYGFQFHPERSGEKGLRLLKEFIGLKRD